MPILKKLRSWCPQPPNPFATKLKHHAAPIAVLLTVTLLTVSFSVFSSTYLFHQPVQQVPVVNVLSSSSSTPSVSPAMEWDVSYGGNAGLSASQVIQTSDGGYAAAGTTNFNDTNAFWLVKTDASGNVVWNQTYGAGSGIDGTSSDNSANSIVQTADGGYVLAGNTFTYGAGASDAWLVKTDSHGNMVWNQTYGGAGLVTLQGPGEYVVGSNGTWYDFAYSLIQTSDGGLAFAGKTLMPNNYALAWLVKTDSSGNVEWNQTYPNRQMGGGGWSTNCLIETSDGGFALAGSWDFTSSANYYYLVKTEPALPPPTPTPSSSPPTGLFSESNLILFASVALAAVLIALVAVAVSRRRKKQTLTIT